MGKNFLFNRWCWDNWIFPCKRMNLDPYITQWTKINSKWISDLNVRARTIKFLQENVCKSSWPWICSGFLDMTSKAQVAREKIHKLDFIKIKNFCASMWRRQWRPTPYSCLENPWMEEPGRLQSMGSLRVGHDWATSLSLFTLMHRRRKWQPTPVFLPGESQGWGSLVGCRLWGRTESDTTEAT